MPLKRDNYEFIIRTEKENKEFLKLLEDAEDKIQQAISKITVTIQNP